MINRVFTSNVRNVFVAGDLHGDYQSFRSILSIYEKCRNDSLLIFLGDYADRGLYGIEIITELNKLLDTREDIIALKGNHEMYIDGKPSFYPCNLIYEAEDKYGSWKKFYEDIMLNFLTKLYIAAIVNNVLFVHAGISSKIRAKDDLMKLSNEIYLLWSDPSPVPGEHSNPRGAGVLFGEDITVKFLSSLDLKMIVRSHEPEKAVRSPYAEHEGKIITTNSCASYGKPFLLKIFTMSLKFRPLFLD
ncbi:MAG: serine/threonine protein phosphatase [Nitrospirae bacterium]|nr:serine/threonine protein phosphatase [Nitrospirota bacterium]